MKKIIDTLVSQDDIKVPWTITSLFGIKSITFSGDQVALSEKTDFGNLDEMRKATEWLVDQLGGNVNWQSTKGDKK